MTKIEIPESQEHGIQDRAYKIARKAHARWCTSCPVVEEALARKASGQKSPALKSIKLETLQPCFDAMADIAEMVMASHYQLLAELDDGLPTIES
jgi:hypothetical protein